jgi:hypothetical protein
VQAEAAGFRERDGSCLASPESRAEAASEAKRKSPLFRGSCPTVEEFEDVNTYNTARRAFIGSDGWKVIGKKVDELGTHTKTAFLNAAPYSKLQ